MKLEKTGSSELRHEWTVCDEGGKVENFLTRPYSHLASTSKFSSVPMAMHIVGKITYSLVKL